MQDNELDDELKPLEEEGGEGIEESEQSLGEDSDPVEDAEAESSEPETAETEEVKPRNRLPSKTRINQERREKYQALNRVQELEREIESLRVRSEQSDQAVMTNYAQNVELRARQAKLDLKAAYESGDSEALANAHQSMTEVAAEKHSVDAWRAQQNNAKAAPRQEAPRDVARAEPEEASPEIQQWVALNDWFSPQSPNFDSKSARRVQNYAIELEQQLAQDGDGDLIGSDEYFDLIDDFVAEHVRPRAPATKPAIRTLQMKPSQSAVAPVTRGGQKATAQKEQIRLSADEKFMARNAGVTEEQWLAAKRRDKDIQKQRGRG